LRGKLILQNSDTSVAIFTPFGFHEDYGAKDMVPMEEQAEINAGPTAHSC
jgi:hypothetical protein